MNIEKHLLTILAEECAEVAQAASKSIRFGINDRNYREPAGPDNKARLVDELNDVMALIEMLIEIGVIKPKWQSGARQQDKIEKVVANMEYARQQLELEAQREFYEIFHFQTCPQIKKP